MLAVVYDYILFFQLMDEKKMLDKGFIIYCLYVSIKEDTDLSFCVMYSLAPP